MKAVPPAMQSWIDKQRPGIAAARQYSFGTVRTMTEALARVDRDVENTGTVSESTINLCRAALALVRA